MALVIKIAGLFSGGESPVVYKDALVNEGTLLLHDYSNRGCLREFSIKHNSTFFDLASDVSKDKLGIDNEGFMDLPENPDIELTEGRGIPMNSIIKYASSVNPKGVNMGTDLTDYLYEEQPRLLALYWARASDEQTINSVFLSSGNQSDRNIVLNTSASSFQGSLAGGSSGSEPLGEGSLKLVQYGVEFSGAGLNNRGFVNGNFKETGSIIPTGFIKETDGLLLGSRISVPEDRNTNTVVYRLMIVDLDKAGMSAEEIVQKDWEYCTGTGQYAGLPTRRPFIDKE